MSIFRSIRDRLRMTQAAIGAAIGVTQGNVSFYEKGQTIPPDVAAQLIELARANGLELTFDHVYGAAALPAPTTARAEPA